MEHPLSAFCLRAQRALAAMAVAGSALAIWPSRLEPFGLPKASLVVLVAVLMATAMVVRSVVTRRIELPIGAIPLGMAAVVACMAVATVASSTPLVSMVGPIRYTGFVPYLAYFVIAVGAMAAFRFVRPRAILVAILVGGAVEVMYGLVQSVGWQPLPFGSFATPVFGTLGNSNFLAGWLAITAPVALWGAMERSHPRNWRIAAAVLTAGCALALWRTNSFQGLPAAAGGGGLVVLVWALTDRPRVSRLLGPVRAVPRPALLGLVVLGALGLVGQAVRLLPAISQRIGSGAAARLEFWAAARRLVLDHPVVGTGPGTFVQHYAAYYEPTGTVAYELADDPHSVPLAMFTNGGFLLGLVYVGFVAATAIVLLGGLRRAEGRERLFLAAFGGAWLAYQVQSAVSIDIPPLAVTHWVLAASIACVTGSIRFGFGRDVDSARPPQRPRIRGRRPLPLPLPTKVAVCSALVLALVLMTFSTRPMRGLEATERVDELISAGQPQLALESAKRATQLAPWDDRAWAEYERVAEGLRRYGTARRAAERAVALAPGNSTYALELASLAQRDQDFDAVVRWSRHAARVDPRNPAVLARVGRNLLRFGHGDEAERLVRSGLRIQESAELWAVLGQRHTLDSQERRAIAAYRRALELDPAHEEAKKFLEARGVT